MRILLNYYHPVVQDLALTLKKLGYSVAVAINTEIRDHYGDWNNLLKDCQEKYKNDDIDYIALKLARIELSQKNYDLVGLDGVFSGDDLLMNICKEKQIAYFCIDGYPNVYNELSDNILSFGWGLPLIQYNQKYSSEYHKKEIDWKNISEKGQSEGKNVCVFYPNFWELNKYQYIKDYSGPIVSGVQNYEKYNKWSYEIFKKIKDNSKIKIENFEKISQKDFLDHLQHSKALLHLKWADRPGIALLEAMLLGKIIFTMKSFVLASFDSEVLINYYNAVIADSVEELIEEINTFSKDEFQFFGNQAREHALMLTNFHRQKNKLQKFLERCI